MTLSDIIPYFLSIGSGILFALCLNLWYEARTILNKAEKRLEEAKKKEAEWREVSKASLAVCRPMAEGLPPDPIDVDYWRFVLDKHGF